MVHALNECRRVLRPGGLLVDLRPFAGNWPLEVVYGGRVWPAGVIDDSQERPNDEAAGAALEESVRAGWFRGEGSATFEYAWYWDTLGDFEAYMAERWTNIMRLPERTRSEAERLMARAGAAARLRFRRGMLIGRYAVLGPYQEEGK